MFSTPFRLGCMCVFCLFLCFVCLCVLCLLPPWQNKVYIYTHPHRFPRSIDLSQLFICIITSRLCCSQYIRASDTFNNGTIDTGNIKGYT